MQRWMHCVACLGTAALASIASARADAVADFYRGKSISLYVSFPPGGGYDIYRIVAAPAATPKELVEQARRYAGQ